MTGVLSSGPRAVVVTGASGLIGGPCTEAFARQGDRVAAIDVMPPSRRERGVFYLTVDLRDENQLERAFDSVEAHLGPVDVLVQCAAVVRRTPFLALTASDVDAVFEINVRALMLAARRAAASMLQAGRHGVIVNVSSTSAVVSDAQSVAYDASKGAVSTATGAMAVALAPYGLRVVAVAPGAMVKDQERPAREPRLDEYERRRIPAGRLGTPADIAAAVCFLASPHASYVNGTVLYVDGGSLVAW